MERSGPPPSAWPAGPAGEAQEKRLPLKRNASAGGLHHTTFAHLRVPVCMWSQNVCRLDVSFPPRRLWPAGRGMTGKDGPAPSALAAAQVEAWLEGRLLQLALAYSVAISTMLCSVPVSGIMLPTVPSQLPYTHRFPPARLARRERHRRSTYCCSVAQLVLEAAGSGGPPSLLRPASSKAQQVPRGQTIWSSALSGLDGPFDTTTRLSLFSCTASGA